MKQDSNVFIVRDIMVEFAGLTGLLSPEKIPRRYLWTDAFAVCNFLELYRQTGDEQYKQLALRLVDQVHEILGRHRKDDVRTGWISGLGEKEGRMHPTTGGLRIGKELPERKSDEASDEDLEWDRDGQYYHYLTKWMHTLNRVSRVTRDATYNLWAIELAKTAHTRFAYAPSPGGPKRMYWKMNTDLSYPVVSSMGHHDPLDGLITYLQLQTTATKLFKKDQDLSIEISDMADMCKGRDWATDDPLGIGELLSGAYRLGQLIADEGVKQEELLEVILDSCLTGLRSFAKSSPLELPTNYRLAFRELGLSIGLRAVERLSGLSDRILAGRSRLASRIENLMKYVSLGDSIEAFWLKPANREGGAWMSHRNINMVMLATSLAPDGYLML